MSRWFVTLVVAFAVGFPSTMEAQTGDGSVRGYVKDEQGAVLPGVTVTAASQTLLTPVSGVTDASGYYRLLNLPPGTYTVSAELAGFTSVRREGLIMRAGLTMTVDIALPIGSLSETITVAGDSPMIETNRPTSVINIEGELLRAAPITSRRLFSDALDMAPGIGSRNVDDGVGRRAYYFRGSHIYAHAFQLEGAPASAYIDSAAHSMGMGGDTVQDVEIKLGGADASTPLSTGVVMNVVTPRGQNAFKGSAAYTFQPMEWNSDNTQGGAAPGGLPTSQSVNQWDLSLGGRIIRDRVWFFATYRYADLQNGISRTPTDLQYLTAFKPDVRAVRQQLEEQAALRQSDDATRDTRAVRVLPERQEPLHELTRALYRSNGNSIRRRLDGPREAELGVGSARDHLVLGVLQQQGRQRRRGLQRHDRIRSAGVGPPDRAHLERPTHRQRHPRGDEQR